MTRHAFRILIRRFSMADRVIQIPHCFELDTLVDVHVLRSNDSISNWVNTVFKDYDLSDEYNKRIDLTDRKVYENIPVVGVDIEWVTRGNYKSKTSLIQIAFENSVLIVQTKYLNNQLPLPLVQLLSSRSILKVGSGIVDDYIKLKKE